MDDFRAAIMIVDDNIANLTLGRNLLKAYYDVYMAHSAEQMFEMLGKIKVDLILLDIDMPVKNGYEVISELKRSERLSGIPVIFLTAYADVESEMKGFELGAVDYVNKPFSPPLLLKRIEHQLTILRQQKKIRHHADGLSVLVSEKTSEVISLQNAILSTVADLVEFRDGFTGRHIARTQLYLKIIIDGMIEEGVYADEMSDWDTDVVLQSAQLHDMGKIAIPDRILNKPGRLDEEEFEIIKTHVKIGIDAVERIMRKTRESRFLIHAYNIVSTHHEKWNGEGYPYRLRGAAIPLEGRMMAIADVYDALVSWRPYKESYNHSEARDIIFTGAGVHFDPVLVEVFAKIERQFEAISSRNADLVKEGYDLLTLTHDMHLGIGEIDGQHRELLRRINDVAALARNPLSHEEAGNMLDFLGDYVITHFRCEEELQKESDYPKYGWHCEQHRRFADEFLKLKADFGIQGFSPDFAKRLNTTVILWITNHIKTVDVEFGQYYRLKEASPMARGEVKLSPPPPPQ